MRAFHTLIVLLMVTTLAACGGSSDEPPAPAKTEVKKEEHILSNEQEALNAAKGLGDLVNKSDEGKKKAMEEAMGN